MSLRDALSGVPFKDVVPGPRGDAPPWPVWARGNMTFGGEEVFVAHRSPSPSCLSSMHIHVWHFQPFVAILAVVARSCYVSIACCNSPWHDCWAVRWTRSKPG